MRAAHYYQTGERFYQRGPRAPELYKKAVRTFADGAAMNLRPFIEPVEVPYGDTSLPALFVHPDREVGGKPAPALVFFDGFDITKEIQYFKGIPDLAARGIGCLIVDGPGNGESVRFRDLPLIAETERYAAAAYEFLASREEIDPDRIGVMAISLGGYYAPRAAAFEPRVKACIALAGPYDFSECWDGLPTLTREAFRVRSKSATIDDAKRAAATLSLKGVADKITCPLFIVTGKLDRIIPWQHSERLAREVKGPVELMIVEDGNHIANNRGYRWRVQSADWMAEQLGARGG
jgi:2,6-dihydroxypseudooxynicotine hydrolase